MTSFVQHTAQTAPESARKTIENTEKGFGFLPAPVALMATSPQLLQGFMDINGRFNQTTLSELEREVVVFTVATRNECHYCVAMHSAMLSRKAYDADVIAALREQKPLTDARLEQLRSFTVTVTDSAGGVSDADMRAFLDQGFTPQNALEVVLGIGTYTISTFANRMTQAPLDEPFQPLAWEPSHG